MAIRTARITEATLLQGNIDALNFVIGEPNRTITRLSNQDGE